MLFEIFMKQQTFHLWTKRLQSQSFKLWNLIASYLFHAKLAFPEESKTLLSLTNINLKLFITLLFLLLHMVIALICDRRILYCSRRRSSIRTYFTLLSRSRGCIKIWRSFWEPLILSPSFLKFILYLLLKLVSFRGVGNSGSWLFEWRYRFYLVHSFTHPTLTVWI